MYPMICTYSFISYWKKHSNGIILCTQDNNDWYLWDRNEAKACGVREGIRGVEYGDKNATNIDER